MKRKLGKITFVLACILVLILPYTSTVLAAALLQHSDDSVYLETLKLHEGGEEATGELRDSYAQLYDESPYAYKIGTTNILKLIVSGDTNYENMLYCLNAEKSFPGTTSLLYNNAGNLKDATNINVKALGLSAQSYKSLIWLVDNMYLKKQTPEQKNEFLSKAFATEIANEEGTTLDLIKAYLTDDDIEVVQQWAMWYFTNGDASNEATYNSKYETFANITLTNMYGESGSYNELTGSTVRQDYANKLYTYLITEAMVAENAEVTYPTIDKTTTPDYEVEGSYYKVGPFKVNSGTASNDSYELVLTDGIDTIERNRYNILIEGQSTFTNENIDEIFDTNYYIYLPIDNNDINRVKLNLKYDCYKTEASIWMNTTTNENNVQIYQPVTLLTRENTPNEEDIFVDIDDISDLALRKYITKINDQVIDRQPNIETSGLSDGTNTTAEYRHAKNPLEVYCGDTIIYEISVYNEGETNASVLEIVDYLPEGLEFVKDSQINETYEWVVSSDGRKVTTTYLANITLAPFFNNTGTGENALISTSVQIECRVADDAQADVVLTNIAEIGSDNINDIDSVPDHININEINAENYKGNNDNKNDLTDSDYHYKGIQDTDDFEKVIVKSKTFDLALRKFISKINNIAPKVSREPQVDVSKLKNGASTDAEYTHPKTPLLVQQGDIVLYTIRVYNEGDVDGYAEEVTDYLPEGLGFLVNHTTNIDNYWKIPDNSVLSRKLGTIANGTSNLSLDDFTEVTDLNDVEVVYGMKEITGPINEQNELTVLPGMLKLTSTKLKSSDTDTKNLINGFDKVNDTELDYKDIQVACIVLTDEISNDNLINIAEIVKHSDENKDTTIEDIDSTPGTVNPHDYPGNDKNQDDNDYEILATQEFDLALQKFITKINNDSITNRIPTITKNSDGTIRYNHSTEPLSVANNDLVTYTIRVYNEGDIDGYAKEIQDDLPNGLIFVPDHETNKKYGWKLYDSDGTMTTDLDEAKTVKTNYLSKEASDAREEDNLIKAFDTTKDINTSSSNPNPDYRDVQIVFKVAESGAPKQDRVIINIAEISANEDADGKDIKDKDSVPGNWKDEEDDIDKERIYVKYFDLAIQKDVVKAIITENGATREVSATDPNLLKIELNRKTWNKAVVKFVFDITVTNQGEIAGYATEVKDHIPAGLEFIQEDNPKWTKASDDIITTRALENTLLQPGESASVQVTFKWINSEKYIGVLKNIVEISEDKNETDSKDIDSTPDNLDKNRPYEDDEDDASVLIGLSTGTQAVYVVLSTTVLAILSIGVVLIKRYVLI